MKKDRIVLIIPSLEPEQALLDFLKQVRNLEQGLAIVIVNDGSAEKYDPIFQKAQDEYSCKVLTHYTNLGKGRALKTAFNYCLCTYPDLLGVVTADADGQHLAEDVFACMDALRYAPDKLILGSRNFSDSSVPWRSSFGNKLTRKVFGWLCGVQVTDTQTGLRGIPSAFLSSLLSVPGERFEYEMNMLIECGERKMEIQEVVIQTVYVDDNRSSHFNPLLDSVRIYAVFLKFIGTALASFLIDIFLFTMLVSLLRGRISSHILIATIAARVISSLANFFLNRTVVFRATNTRGTAVKYYCLASLQMLVSALLVTWLYGISHFGETFFKIIVDLALFFISFQVQKHWVFAEKEPKK